MTMFLVGDRVGYTYTKPRYNEYDDKPQYGIITDILSDGRAMVKWDEEWQNTHAKPISVQRLVTESTLKAQYSELEQVFHKVEAEVQDKMKEAGQLILDAQNIAMAAGFNLKELSEATSALEHAMEEAGWQTSSWHC